MIEFLKQIKEFLPGPLQHLNLGGGFPISYIGKANTDNSPNHLSETYTAAITNDDVATALIAPIRECFGSDLELIVEPGRSIIADTAILMTRVEATKQRQGPRWLYLDAGYGIMLDAVFGWYFHMVTANRADDKVTASFRVFGPLCDSYDAFYDVSGEAAIASLLQQAPALDSHRDLLDKVLLHQPGLKELPACTGIGDMVAVFDVGAYNIDTQSQYCGRLQPSVSLITMDGTITEIRRAETLEDLVARD